MARLPPRYQCEQCQEIVESEWVVPETEEGESLGEGYWEPPKGWVVLEEIDAGEGVYCSLSCLQAWLVEQIVSRR